MSNRTILLGGGCFWCIESVFQDIKGVQSCTSGYAGGTDENPTYKKICSGLSDHAEVVRIEYDDSLFPLTSLLDLFFAFHNPTTLNRQGNDVGTQYRSAIYYVDDSEKDVIDQAALRAEKNWGLPIVTEIKRDVIFYPAEDYHQNYYNNNPDQGYCQFVISPKVSKLRKHYSHLLKVVVIFLGMLSGFQATSQVDFSMPSTVVERKLDGIPVIKVYVHLLNQTQSSDKLKKLVYENIALLNKEFENSIRFTVQGIGFSPRKAELPDLYNDFYLNDRALISDVIVGLEKSNVLNIFVTPTYYEDVIEAELMGFTPVLKARQYAYAQNSPLFDRMYISYKGLESKLTLIHEMGHFFGLKHPWEMADFNLELMGLDRESKNNHMTYDEGADHFTEEQLSSMQYNALQFRYYLCSTILSVR